MPVPVTRSIGDVVPSLFPFASDWRLVHSSNPKEPTDGGTGVAETLPRRATRIPRLATVMPIPSFSTSSADRASCVSKMNERPSMRGTHLLSPPARATHCDRPLTNHLVASMCSSCPGRPEWSPPEWCTEPGERVGAELTSVTACPKCVLDGLHVFCAVLAWSRFRFVRFAADEKAVTTLGLLAECFEELGGVPEVVLAGRMGCLKGGASRSATSHAVTISSHGPIVGDVRTGTLRAGGVESANAARTVRRCTQ